MDHTPAGTKKRKVCASEQKPPRVSKEARFHEMNTIDRFEQDRRKRDNELNHRASIFSGAVRISKHHKQRKAEPRTERVSSVHLTPRETMFTPRSERTVDTRRSTLQPLYNRSNTPNVPRTTTLTNCAPTARHDSSASSPYVPKTETATTPRRPPSQTQQPLAKALARPKEQPSVAACFGSHLSEVLHTYSLSRTPARQHVKSLVRTPATTIGSKSAHHPAGNATPYSRYRDCGTPYSGYRPSTTSRRPVANDDSQPLQQQPDSPTQPFSPTRQSEVASEKNDDLFHERVEEATDEAASPIIVRRLCL